MSENSIESDSYLMTEEDDFDKAIDNIVNTHNSDDSTNSRSIYSDDSTGSSCSDKSDGSNYINSESSNDINDCFITTKKEELIDQPNIIKRINKTMRIIKQYKFELNESDNKIKSVNPNNIIKLPKEEIHQIKLIKRKFIR